MKHLRLFGLLLATLIPFTTWAQSTYNVVKIQNKRTTTHYMVASNGTVQHLDDPGTAAAKWIIHNVAGGVTLQNVATGLYIGELSKGKETKLLSTPAVFVKADEGGYSTFANNEMWANSDGGSSKLIGWSPVDDGSRWKLVDAGTISSNELADIIDEAQGLAKPADVTYCRILAPAYDAYLTEDYSSMTLNCQGFIAPENSPYRQLWKLIATSDGNVKIQNIYTGHYIKAVSGASQNVCTADNEAEAGTYAITTSAKSEVPRYYVIATANGSGYNKLHCASGKQVVGWEAGSTGGINGSEWQFAPIPLTDQEIADAREDYASKNTLLINATKYQTILDNIFADKACTQLRADADYSQLAELPQILQDMVAKVKDNAWKQYASGNNWEKMFRIADYHVYSKHDKICWEVGMSNAFGRLSNPTGIFCQAGDVMAIMVDKPAPAGTVLKIERVAYDQENAGNQFELKQGLNFITADKRSTFYVFYELEDSDNDPAFYLEKFPDVTVHIEGGDICGYWDKTRGMTDTEWNAMLSDGLLQYDRIAMKSDNIMMAMNGTLVKKHVGDKVERIVKIWDRIISRQNELMGINDTYIPTISKRFNNLFIAISVTYNYMFASTYGTYYEEGTLSEILNYDKMIKTGAIWGPAHEIGHNHQVLITPAGTMEVSNNLFSNVEVYYQGAITSRGPGMNVSHTVYPENAELGLPTYMIKKKPWIEYDIWQKTQMYWKLFQYFHIAGNDTEFYPKLFTALRKDGMAHTANCQLNADVDYLKFALKCCEVAQADLSEFFECYGMFLPMDETTQEVNGQTFKAYHVGDYANYYLHVTQDMIDAAKKKMKSYPKKIKNIFFIDDRIKAAPATYEGHAEGEIRQAISEEWPLYIYGDCDCQYTDYAAENMKFADSYFYTLLGLKFTAKGTGAVGFKFYDKNDNLIYISAFKSVTLPQSVKDALGNGGYVVAAQANGTDVEMTQKDKHAYETRTWRGAENKVTTAYVSGQHINPANTMEDGWVMTVSPKGDSKAEDYRYRAEDNICIDGNFATLRVTDGTPMYIPATAEQPATATATTFKRNDAKGWSTLTLPFAFKPADISNGVTVYVVTNIDNTAKTVDIISVRPGETIQPGQPVLLNSTKNTITIKSSATTAHTELAATEGVALQGTFQGIAGGYDINTDGTAFAAAETVLPMHAALTEGYAIGTVADGITAIRDTQNAEDMYNLSGIHIYTVRKGEPYIKGGRLYLNR